jgi:putative ABC transport system ATP-binding protein
VSEPLITIRDLRYRYADTQEDILRIPFLDISGRGLIAITGPSGVGKTTLVELLAGTLQEPYEGTVTVLGADWQQLRRDADRQRQLRRIGLIPQDFGLLPSWTARRTLEQDLSDADVAMEQRPARCAESLAQVGLTDVAEREIGSLSGGQRQRVAIARMLARDVELVIADEPTANLDPGLVGEIAELFKVLARKVPVIVVTHDPRLAEMCDRTIVLQSAVTSSSASRPDAAGLPPRAHHRRRLVAVAVAVVVLAAAAVAAFLVVNGRQPQHQSANSASVSSLATPASSPSSVPTPASVATASANSGGVVTTALPVHVLPTQFGIDGQPAPTYPARVMVSIPRTWAGQLAAYGVVGVVLLDPSGWTEQGNSALIAADGSSGATLQAAGSSMVQGRLNYVKEATGPGGYAAADAAAYFPWVRSKWATWGFATSLPTARAGLVEHLVNDQLAEYSLTSGPEVDDGLQVNGIAHVTIFSGGGELSFDYLEVALPPSDHGLATVILNYYLSSLKQ